MSFLFFSKKMFHFVQVIIWAQIYNSPFLWKRVNLCLILYYCLPSFSIAQVTSVEWGLYQKNQLFCPVHCKNSILLFYLIHYKVAVSFILKEIKSKVKRDANNGDFVAMYFLEIFHQGVKQTKNVFLSKLQMLKLMVYIRIGFRFNSSE